MSFMYEVFLGSLLGRDYMLNRQGITGSQRCTQRCIGIIGVALLVFLSEVWNKEPNPTEIYSNEQSFRVVSRSQTD